MDDARNVELKPIYQCGECSTLFLQFATVVLNGEVHKICPNPNCHGPVNMCSPIQNQAVWWLFNHILQHSGIDETRRLSLRDIAESQMGPWNELYRSL